MIVATASQVAEYRATIDDLTLAAIGDGKALLSEVANPNPIAVRVGLQEALPALLQPYVTASAELAAVWYETLRADAVGGSFSASTVDGLPDGLAGGVARYAVTPLFFQSTGTVLAMLASGLQKAIASAGRETIDRNVRVDRTDVKYARMPRPGCCQWCAMLASRGAVYGGDETASQGHGFDRCVAVPTWLGQDLPYDPGTFLTQYEANRAS